jgi:uncharacterized protein
VGTWRSGKDVNWGVAVNTTIEFSWKRYALIAELAKRLNNKCPQFGKTALQKLVFFLQEVYGVDCGYDFQLYSYGPYDAQLLADLDLVEAWGYVSIRQINAGFEIRPTKKVDLLRNKASDFLKDPKTAKSLKSLVSNYGNMSARELELRATTVYVEQDFRDKREIPSARQLLDIVGSIKPKFSTQDIEKAIDELKKRAHIQIAD